VVLVIPVVLEPTPIQSTLLGFASAAIWFVFAVDYVTWLYLALDRWRFVRTHGLDLAVVLVPMLRPLRALRAVRVLRLLRLASAGVSKSSATPLTYIDPAVGEWTPVRILARVLFPLPFSASSACTSPRRISRQQASAMTGPNCL